MPMILDHILVPKWPFIGYDSNGYGSWVIGLDNFIDMLADNDFWLLVSPWLEIQVDCLERQKVKNFRVISPIRYKL